MSGFSAESRRVITSRAGVVGHRVRCERCGTWCNKGWYELHHRMPRGMGGSKSSSANHPANSICVCKQCHGWIESNRIESYRHGWLISMHRKDTEPSQVPVLLHDGWFLLSPDGERYSIPEPAGGRVA